ncbi:hypothetical protein ACF5W4_17625 [Bacillota bacterium Lsc_1132]
MECKQDVVSSLEQLLESLIKMVGKSNQSIDHLQQRVSQLEWLLMEQREIKRSQTRILLHPDRKQPKL